MKAPLKSKMVNAIHAHQFLWIQGVEGLLPYVCPDDGEMLLAREEGLYCAKCDYTTDKVTYPGKMNTEGKIPGRDFG